MALDDQDELDERIKQELRYSVRLLIKHPNIDPTKITEKFGFDPKMTHVAGTPRKDPKGGRFLACTRRARGAIGFESKEIGCFSKMS
jgi:hypothetical protein